MSSSSSTPADAAIEDLLRGGKLSSGKAVVGPLEPAALQLLRVVWDTRADLTRRKGTDQAIAARASYVAAGRPADAASSAPSSTVEVPTLRLAEPPPTAPSETPRWRLHELRSHSIRGIAPHGVTVTFAFDGVAMLIYGPNGSGKSSLLSAVGWVLTGKVVTDCEEETESFSLYAPPTAAGRVAKLRDWPAIHTLPQGENPASIVPDCWAVLALKSEDGSRRLFLKRSLASGLEQSIDAVSWESCVSLSDHGISALDVHLSVSAATALSRRTLESSPDTRHLLSMMLGYDPLEDLGSLVTTLATNLTKAANTDRDALTARRQRQKLLLFSLASKLRNGLELRQKVESLSDDADPDEARIKEVAGVAASAVVEAEIAIASLLDIKAEGRAVPTGLADALTSAVRTLETSAEELFPEFHSLLAVNGEPATASREDTVAAASKALAAFEQSAQTRIAERLTWWKRETIPGSKATLLIQAATHFVPGDEACPVCEQEISGSELAVQLAGLKGASADLRASLREFFRNLVEEVRSTVSATILKLSAKDPARCLREDWAAIEEELGTAITPITERFHPEFEALVEALPPVEFKAAELIPADADSAFAEAATPFLAVMREARRGVAIAEWANRHLLGVTERLGQLTTSSDIDSVSLLGVLSRGKHAAVDVEPIVAVRESLKEASSEAAGIKAAVEALAVLEEMHSALEAIKPLGKYATAEVERVFANIREKTIENTRKLYPHANPDLSPSRLHLNKGRDKSVEAYLSAGAFEVPGQHIANAGLLRAIALAFYFALLERHPGGLAFVVMDDPILSLDDDHREAWSANILKPALVTTQVVVATHQRQFLNNCKSDFHPGRLVELNPRTRSEQVTYRPGDRLDRAEELLSTATMSVPNELRKYREDLIITLDAYSPTAFFNPSKLRHSLDTYLGLTAPHPLASANQAKIGKRVREEKVTRVLDPGSHSMTEADVTEPMIRDCLTELRELDITFRNELDRLEAERLRVLRNRTLPLPPTLAVSSGLVPAIVIPIDRLQVGDDAAAWATPVRLRIIGTAAAQTHGCVVDLVEEPFESDFPAGGAVLVSSETLCPIARPGQWVLLSDGADDGDLVAVLDHVGNRYLRRGWSVGNYWFLEVVNPSIGIAPVSVRKSDCKVRKVNGVSYSPRKNLVQGNGKFVNEWLPRQDFKANYIDGLFGIAVKGTSLEPIVLNGQVVLVSRKMDSRFDRVGRGSLAVVETDEDRVGNVIKRIFPGEREWLLTSPNPIEPRDPIAIANGMIRAVWPICGVLFAVTNIELSEIGE
jgi:energy-coupling factor transporter ATP-binding protein EcfA2